ncbi:hypothetical protein [Sphaerospermopsis reniformis]|uniref:hypothetical protein n=1 Tax=Sphaerospermopsis reniformis TaxID=531300 RepID=UPI001F2751A7|nr:hypothetical protein [Sphaerospermopsis reniformis]
MDQLTETERDNLAGHFIQRRRADVKLWLGNETPFPQRQSDEEPYKLSKEYKELFEEVYNFARGLVKTTTVDMTYAQRRGRYWSALALIRCVMSSPAAAISTLNRSLNRESGVGSRESGVGSRESGEMRESGVGSRESGEMRESGVGSRETGSMRKQRVERKRTRLKGSKIQKSSMLSSA